MGKTKVLFIDDDIALGKIVTLALNEAGYETYYQTSLTAIQSVLKEIQPDIIILDVEIGERDGIDITPELRIISPATPILFVSSHVGSHDVARALHAGGVVYLKKPFEIAELLAYIKRYAPPLSAHSILLGSLSFHPKEKLLIKANQAVEKLTVLECRLLTYLILNKNKVVTRRELELELWGKESGHEHSLNNYIGRLRKQLASEKDIELLTISKIGYRFIM